MTSNPFLGQNVPRFDRSRAKSNLPTPFQRQKRPSNDLPTPKNNAYQRPSIAFHRLPTGGTFHPHTPRALEGPPGPLALRGREPSSALKKWERAERKDKMSGRYGERRRTQSKENEKRARRRIGRGREISSKQADAKMAVRPPQIVYYFVQIVSAQNRSSAR